MSGSFGRTSTTTNANPAEIDSILSPYTVRGETRLQTLLRMRKGGKLNKNVMDSIKGIG